jgi:hypothetical protein
MADTGTQSPLGINVVGSYLQNQGLTINPIAASYMGASKTNTDYTFGTLVSGTCLRMLTWAINDAYLRTLVTSGVYNNLIAIGSASIPALGNSKPASYVAIDPAGIWARPADSVTPSISEKYGIQQGVSGALPGPATSGYSITSATNQGQEATWLPYDSSNPNAAVTQWGYIRLHALQAWNEFNWNGGEVSAANPEYPEFLASFLSALSFVESVSQTVMSNQNAKTFLDGTFSNMDDLISADVFGVNLANKEFGQDLENLGKILNLSDISSFGLPSSLLKILGENNAVIPDLVLALLSAGLENTELQQLVSGKLQSPTKTQERQIYSAFLIMVGENLSDIIAPLQCQIEGLESLADLLDVKKLFPNSYQSLTVPKYNGELGLPTNSKTYYPLYIFGGLNPALTSPDMDTYVGAQTPNNVPSAVSSIQSVDNTVALIKGFGSYLRGVIPLEQAVAAGAFSFAMRQIRNIDRADIQQFARAVKSLESTIDFPLVSGTSKPTSQEAIDSLQLKEALGSGPYGTYTMSDFFGSMSGLPYPWENLYNRMLEAETDTLKSIYRDLFLAVSWKPATVSVQYTSYVVESPPTVFTTYYNVTGVTLTDLGGGYGRGGAAAPTISINGGSGATATATIETDDSLVGSNGGGLFGRVTSVELTSSGTDTTTLPTVTIEAPPTSTGGGTNTASGTTGWPSPMNTVVQNYIDLANAEISLISQNNLEVTQLLNTYWNILGGQLVIEQRARYTALPPVAVPKDLFAYPYPSTINSFVDSIPTIAQDTKPHMSAQTLEAICNLDTLGGQSAVVQMRQERNQIRLISAGIPLDNHIADTMSLMDEKTLTTNGTIPAAINNPITSPIIDIVKEDPGTYGNVLVGVTGFTTASWPTNKLGNRVITPRPNGTYFPSDSTLIGEFLTTRTTSPGDITPILNGVSVAVVGPTVPSSLNPIVRPDRIIISTPEQLATDIPFEVDSDYTGSTLYPAVYSVNEAIERVIECNCDCWIN